MRTGADGEPREREREENRASIRIYKWIRVAFAAKIRPNNRRRRVSRLVCASRVRSAAPCSLAAAAAKKAPADSATIGARDALRCVGVWVENRLGGLQ